MLDLAPKAERSRPDRDRLARRNRRAAAHAASSRLCATPMTTFAHFRAKCDAAGVHPVDCRMLERSRRLSLHHQGRPARHLSVRHVRGAARQDRALPRLVAARPASRPWSATPRRDVDMWSDVMARSIRAAGGRPGMKVHVAYGYGLFTGGLGAHYGAERLGCAVIPVSGGMTERQVQLIRDFKPDIMMVTPSYMLAILDEFRKAERSIPATAASRSASSAPSPGRMRCAPRSSRVSTCTPSTSTASRK